MLPATLPQKELWDDTPFYLLGGYGREVRTINFVDRPAEEFKTTCHDALDSYDAVESVGIVVSMLRALSPEELHERITREMEAGYRYLFVYRNEEEMTAALDGKVYAISDTDGKFLCDLYEPDYICMERMAISWIPYLSETCAFIPIGQSPTPRYATGFSPPGW